MTTQVTTFLYRWMAACHNALGVMWDIRAALAGKPESAPALAPLTAAIRNANQALDSSDFNSETMEKAARLAMELAEGLQALAARVGQRDQDFLAAVEEYSEHAEVLAMSCDPEILASIEETKRELAEGKTIPAEDIFS